MFLDEKYCKDTINALAYQDWQPLLDMIPEIENAPSFGELRGEIGVKKELSNSHIAYLHLLFLCFWKLSSKENFNFFAAEQK